MRLDHLLSREKRREAMPHGYPRSIVSGNRRGESLKGRTETNKNARGAKRKRSAGRRAGQRTGKPSGMTRSLLFPSCIVLKVRHERVFPRESLRKSISEKRDSERDTPADAHLENLISKRRKRNRVKQGTGRRREAETLKEAGR